MAARCWWCEVGAPMFRDVGHQDPLGTCWECHVFACAGHATWDPGPGKWLCAPSLAQAAAAGAGVGTVSHEETVVNTSDELQARAPELMRASKGQRQFFRSGDGEGQIGEALHAAPVSWERVDFFLLADAVGIVRFLDPDPARTAFADVEMQRSTPVAAGLFGALIEAIAL